MGKANIIIHIFAGPICWRASFWFDMVYCVCDTGDKKKRVMSAIHGWPAVISVVFPAKVYSMTKRYKKILPVFNKVQAFLYFRFLKHSIAVSSVSITKQTCIKAKYTCYFRSPLWKLIGDYSRLVRASINLWIRFICTSHLVIPSTLL